MKYKAIKFFAYKAYNSIKGIIEEVEREKLMRTIGHVGTGTHIDYPFEFGAPEKISIGENSYLCKNSRLGVAGSNKDSEICIGKNWYIAYNFTALAGRKLIIGNDVLIASNVSLIGFNHGMNPENGQTYMQQDLVENDIIIGDGCWIGERSIVLSGVAIGEKCIIASGAIVTHSIPPYSIVGGNPARIIKKYNFDMHKWERLDNI